MRILLAVAVVLMGWIAAEAQESAPATPGPGWGRLVTITRAGAEDPLLEQAKSIELCFGMVIDGGKADRLAVLPGL